MTSKEALEEIQEHITKAQKNIDIIKTDLEVLEILKKQFYFKLIEYDWGSILSIVDKEDLKDYDGVDVTARTCLDKVGASIIKEWLENEK